jgi:hypothetical protein
MKLKDLKRGQIIQLRWEYWDHIEDGFLPRVIHMVLLHRNDNPNFVPPKKARGWDAKVIYDSSPKESGSGTVPYDNTYYDTWLNMSISENKLSILSDVENEI